MASNNCSASCTVKNNLFVELRLTACNIIIQTKKLNDQLHNHSGQLPNVYDAAAYRLTRQVSEVQELSAKVQNEVKSLHEFPTFIERTRKLLQEKRQEVANIQAHLQKYGYVPPTARELAESAAAAATALEEKVVVEEHSAPSNEDYGELFSPVLSAVSMKVLGLTAPAAPLRTRPPLTLVNPLLPSPASTHPPPSDVLMQFVQPPCQREGGGQTAAAATTAAAAMTAAATVAAQSTGATTLKPPLIIVETWHGKKSTEEEYYEETVTDTARSDCSSATKQSLFHGVAVINNTNNSNTTQGPWYTETSAVSRERMVQYSRQLQAGSVAQPLAESVRQLQAGSVGQLQAGSVGQPLARSVRQLQAGSVRQLQAGSVGQPLAGSVRPPPLGRPQRNSRLNQERSLEKKSASSYLSSSPQFVTPKTKKNIENWLWEGDCSPSSMMPSSRTAPQLLHNTRSRQLLLSASPSLKAASLETNASKPAATTSGINTDDMPPIQQLSLQSHEQPLGVNMSVVNYNNVCEAGPVDCNDVSLEEPTMSLTTLKILAHFRKERQQREVDSRNTKSLDFLSTYTSGGVDIPKSIFVHVEPELEQPIDYSCKSRARSQSRIMNLDEPIPYNCDVTAAAREIDPKIDTPEEPVLNYNYSKVAGVNKIDVQEATVLTHGYSKVNKSKSKVDTPEEPILYYDFTTTASTHVDTPEEPVLTFNSNKEHQLLPSYGKEAPLLISHIDAKHKHLQQERHSSTGQASRLICDTPQRLQPKPHQQSLDDLPQLSDRTKRCLLQHNQMSNFYVKTAESKTNFNESVIPTSDKNKTNIKTLHYSAYKENNPPQPSVIVENTSATTNFSTGQKQTKPISTTTVSIHKINTPRDLTNKSSLDFDGQKVDPDNKKYDDDVSYHYDTGGGGCLVRSVTGDTNDNSLLELSRLNNNSVNQQLSRNHKRSNIPDNSFSQAMLQYSHIPGSPMPAHMTPTRNYHHH